MTKFSIIVPVYNSEPYLGRCIESVLSQKYSDWELLLVDDGSTDRSGELLDNYAIADARLHVFHQENQGQFQARQTGICHATGEYLLFLDSDDEMEKNCLEVVENQIQSEHPDILLFSGSVIENGVDSGRTLGRIYSEKHRISINFLRETVLFDDSLNSLYLKAFHRRLFDGELINSASFFGPCVGEDKAQLLFLLSNAESAYYIPQKLYRYYRYAGSISRSYTVNNITRMLADGKFEIVRYYMDVWGYTDDQSEELFKVYYLRHVFSVYFGTRKNCQTRQEREYLKKYPWEKITYSDMKRFCFSAETGLKEKLKLLAFMLRL